MIRNLIKGGKKIPIKQMPNTPPAHQKHEANRLPGQPGPYSDSYISDHQAGGQNLSLIF